MLLLPIVTALAIALSPIPVRAGINVTLANATLVDTHLVSTFARYMRYSAADYCLVGLDVMDWSCRLCKDNGTEGTKVIGKLSNRLRPGEYSGYVAIEPNDAAIVFAISGTRSLSDWAQDVRVIAPERNVQTHFPDAPAGSLVGQGFWDLFVEGIPSIQMHIDVMLPRYPHIKNIVFTGHSLGGIQMNLNAGYFWPQLTSKGYTLTTYAFAPARTVNDVFAKYLSVLPAYQDGSFYRVFQRTDIVPNLVPPIPPNSYRQLAVEYIIDVEESGEPAPVYRCPPPAFATENDYCMRDVPLWELSLVPGHVTYFGIELLWECYLPNFGSLGTP